MSVFSEYGGVFMNKYSRYIYKNYRVYGVSAGVVECVCENPEIYCYVGKSDAISFQNKEFIDEGLVNLNGDSVVRWDFSSLVEMKKFVNVCKRSGVEVYESDVSIINKVMFDNKFEIDVGQRKLWYDIETNRDKTIKSIAGIGYDGREFFCDDGGLIEDFYDFVMDYDILLGWNNLAFDREFLLKEFGGDEAYMLKNEIDIMLEYKKKNSEASYTLEYIGKKVGMDKLEFREDLSGEELKRYNLRDVEITKAIDENYGLSDIALNLSKLSRMPQPKQCGMMGFIDNILLIEAKSKGFVLPDVKNNKIPDGKRFSGATIFEPKPGRWDGVGVFDFKALYPNIVVNERISPDKDRVILPDMVSRIMRDEEVIKKKIKTNKKFKYERGALKILRNAIYGVMGNPSFRVFDVDIASRITEKARNMLSLLKQLVEDVGLEVIYGDTDSIFVKLESMNQGEKLVKMLNRRMNPYKVEFEKYFETLLFFSDSDGNGVKKRYGGKDLISGETIVKGLEMKRSDSFELLNRIQKEMLNLLLGGCDESEVRRYVEEMKVRIICGEFDKELIFSKGVKEDINEYKVEAPQVKVMRKMLNAGLEVGYRVYYVMTSDGVEPVIDGKIPDNINRDWYIKNRIGPMVKRMLSVFGIAKQKRLI